MSEEKAKKHRSTKHSPESENTSTAKFNFKNLFLFLGKTVLALYVLVSAVTLFTFWERIGAIEDLVIPKPAFSVADLSKVAKEIGLNEKEFKKCVDSGATANNVNDDFQSGRLAGIQGTPGSILVNLATNEAVSINGGAMPYESIKPLIDEYMSGKTLEEINAPYLESGGEIMTLVSSLTPITDDDVKRGGSNAKFALVEYSDFECPYCARFHPTVKDLLSTYGDDMVWVYRHFPLSFHPNAQKYAEAAECARIQGGDEAFWEMGDTIFEVQSN